MSVNRCPYEQKLIEEINLKFNGFRGGELIQSNERQKNIVQDPLKIAREWKADIVSEQENR